MKTLLICAALVVLCLGQDGPSVAKGHTAIYFTEASIIEISNNDGRIVAIAKDGSVAYGKGYTPDDASKKFWEAMSQQYGVVCEAKAKQNEKTKP